MQINEAKKEDRRKKRTRQLLRDSLMQLIIERGYEAITIQDIADRADVARTTFYLHFHDKEELLNSTMSEWYDELVSNHPAITREALCEKGIADDMVDAADFRHVAEHAEFYRTMLSSRGSAGFIVNVLEYLAKVMREDILRPLALNQENRLPLDFMAYFYAGAEVGITAWWLKHNLPCSPEDIAKMQFMLCAHGLRWAVGLDEIPPDG